ncbi:MAG TPA: histidine phosphatase family protein [Thermoplasmata archaeon]|nr:histidine phosphatase family protein [Thermoplasmata archaeon]
MRHGEIVRPIGTSNFDRAPLSDLGRRQIEALAAAWPVNPPTRVYASPLRRSIETAIVLSERFKAQIMKRPCLREWSADDSGIPQPEYKALEMRAWQDLDFVPPVKESLSMAAVRGRDCLQMIGSENEGRTVAIAGHGTLFSLVLSEIKGSRLDEAYKDSIGFGNAAIVEAGSGLRLVREFAAYGRAVA